MTIDSPVKPRIDTRGLPEGFDPHMFYEYRIQQNSETASGLEGFLYKLLPYELIRSFAIAIDPFHQFKVAPMAITPANRKRIRQTVSVFDYSLVQNTADVSTWISAYNWQGTPGANGPPQAGPPLHYTGTEPTYAPLSANVMESNDTTRRTRLMGSKDGTFDKFKYSVGSPMRRVERIESSRLRYSGAPYGVSGSPGVYGYDNIYNLTWNYRSSVTPGAVYPLYAIDQLREHEFDIAETLMSKHAVAMFKGILPSRRDYTLFRNIVELRDIPHSIIQLDKTLRHLESLYDVIKLSKKLKRKLISFNTALEDIPKEYLSFVFGWRQTYKDITDLLGVPEKMSKKFNFLLTRSGKPTSYRSKRNFLLSGDSVPSFYYPGLHWEEFPETSTTVARSCELRMVVNSTFDFPPLNPVTFRRSEFIRKLGVVPTFTDLYNLVPWTWLLDWYTGFGNYIDLIEEVNNDRSLINYGFITCVSKGQVQTTRKWYDARSDRVDNGSGFVDTNPAWIRRTHTSTLDFEFQLRKDLGAVMDVRTISDPSTLSTYQNSILGALLAQRTNFRRT
jgi:hypothetical protein